MGESWVGSRLSEYLVELTDGIGARWAGTEGDIRAAHYIRALMESFGLYARLEEFELDTWDHGACSATLVPLPAPRERSARLGAPGEGSPGFVSPSTGEMSPPWATERVTPPAFVPFPQGPRSDRGGPKGEGVSEVPQSVTVLPMLNCPPLDLKAPLIDVGFGMPHELDPIRDKLRGAVAVMNMGLEPFSTPRTVADRILDLAEAKCAAVIAVDGRSGGRIEYDRATDKRRAERAGLILPHPAPTIQTHKEGGIAFRRAARAGQSVHIRVESRSFKASCWNTVADLRGSKWPDETLIISAHHDTYPNSPGAVDNGSGSVVVMDVARTLGAMQRELGISPGRTIRFCTFSGEEQNHQGSAAYVRRHYPAPSSFTPSKGEMSPPAPLVSPPQGEMSPLRATERVSSETPPRFVINLDEVAAGPIKGLALQFPHLRPLMQKTLDELGEGLKAHVMPMLDHTNDGFSFARSAIPYAILWRWRFVGRHPDADFRAEPWDTADKVRIRELKEYGAYLARILLRLSHVPPESWPPNPVTVAQVEAQIKQEIGKIQRVM